MTEFALCCSGLTKQFGATRAVDAVELHIRKGEILALVGPSGCGKTTLLRLLAGFERPDAGEIYLQGQLVAGLKTFVPPERRGVGMVFQEYALFPHLTVAENIAFGLVGKDRRVRAMRVAEMLALVGLSGYGERYPHQLSGGERQRVALARALAPNPVLVLLDEPFSSLDADRRALVREEVHGILKRAGATAVFVTHDQEEALVMGDRLAVLRQGRLEQVDGPDVVFHNPATRFVAEFMGQTDFLPGQVTSEGIRTEVGLLPQRVRAPEGAEVELAVRGDDIAISTEPRGQAGIPGMVIGCRFQGAQNIYRLRLPSGCILHSIQPHTCRVATGEQVCVFADPGHPLACFYEGRAVAVEATAVESTGVESTTIDSAAKS